MLSDRGGGQLGLVDRRESRLQLLGQERAERGGVAEAMDRRLRSRLLSIALLGLWSAAVKRTQRVQDWDCDCHVCPDMDLSTGNLGRR